MLSYQRAFKCLNILLSIGLPSNQGCHKGHLGIPFIMKQAALLLSRENPAESVLYFHAEGERQVSCICCREAYTEMADLTKVGPCLKSINFKSKLVAVFCCLYDEFQAVAPTGWCALLPSKDLVGRMAVLGSPSCVFHQLDLVD